MASAHNFAIVKHSHASNIRASSQRAVPLQGAGQQTLGAKIYACTHWGLGTTLLWLFAFKLGLGVRGIWGALAVVSNVQCVFMAVRSFCKRDSAL